MTDLDKPWIVRFRGRVEDGFAWALVTLEISESAPSDVMAVYRASRFVPDRIKVESIQVVADGL